MPDGPDAEFRTIEDQLVEMIQELRDLVDGLERGVIDPEEKHKRRRSLTALELVRRSRLRIRDGFPTTTRAGVGGPSSVTDDEDKPMPPVSDPTGELVVVELTEPITRDVVRRAAADVLRGMKGAVGDLRMATAALVRAEPDDPDELPPDDQVWCENHLRHGFFEPRFPRSTDSSVVDCRWCWDFNRIYRVKPPRRLLVLRSEGKRVTEKEIDLALGRKQRKQRAG